MDIDPFIDDSHAQRCRVACFMLCRIILWLFHHPLATIILLLPWPWDLFGHPCVLIMPNGTIRVLCLWFTPWYYRPSFAPTQVWLLLIQEGINPAPSDLLEAISQAPVTAKAIFGVSLVLHQIQIVLIACCLIVSKTYLAWGLWIDFPKACKVSIQFPCPIDCLLAKVIVVCKPSQHAWLHILSLL